MSRLEQHSFSRRHRPRRSKGGRDTVCREHEDHTCPNSPRQSSDTRFLDPAKKKASFPSNHSRESARRWIRRETAPRQVPETHRELGSGRRAVFDRNQHSPVPLFSTVVTAEERVTSLLYCCFRQPGRLEPGIASGLPIKLPARRKRIVSTHNGLFQVYRVKNFTNCGKRGFLKDFRLQNEESGSQGG